MQPTGNQDTSRLPVHLGAFESTRIHGFNTDVLETTRHLWQWREDLDLLLSADIRSLRYSAPWHRIESKPGEFDFSWLDGPMRHMRQNGMHPIMDLIHHTSFPDWLTGGFANPEFPWLYARFVERFAQRYEWVDAVTLFNEPLATTLMCSWIGAWYPFLKTGEDFARMAVNVARAICLAEQVMRRCRNDYSSVYIDTCEYHHSLDNQSARWTEFLNQRRYALLDLVLGRMSSRHPLWKFFRSSGAGDRKLAWLRDNPIRVDVLGLDYYAHSEMDWQGGVESSQPQLLWPVSSPRGFASVAGDYVSRYHLPIMLTETNVRGTVTDRITWLRFMEEQTEILSRETPVLGFCWYPSIDSTDWCYLCARSTNAVDPQGIWYLDDERRVRYASELSDWYSRLAAGKAHYSDLPAYRFGEPLDRDLAGYLKLMRHWSGWSDVLDAEKAA